VIWGLKRQNVALPIGKSILNRTSRTDIGRLALSYGGGGHENAGTCQIDTDKIEPTLAEIIAKNPRGW